MLTLRVLGSAAGGGYPQWNCNCPRCHGVREGTLQARRRTQSSIAISHDNLEWLLFNASPDILQQIQAFDALQPARALRDTGIAGVVLMDAQIDHTTGLLMLREHQQRMPLWCTGPVREDLQHGNPLFKVLEHYCGVDWHDIDIADGSAEPSLTFGTLQIHALPLTSNAPPYSPHRDQPVAGDTIGVSIVDEQSGRRLFYAPGLGEMEPPVWQAMQEADVVLVDGTMWTDDEMITLGASKKTARSMGHMPQSGDDGMIAWLDKLPAGTRKVLIHINNTNPILDEDSPQRRELAAHDIEVAFDGMEIRLS